MAADGDNSPRFIRIDPSSGRPDDVPGWGISLIGTCGHNDVRCAVSNHIIFDASFFFCSPSRFDLVFVLQPHANNTGTLAPLCPNTDELATLTAKVGCGSSWMLCCRAHVPSRLVSRQVNFTPPTFAAPHSTLTASTLERPRTASGGSTTHPLAHLPCLHAPCGPRCRRPHCGCQWSARHRAASR